MYIVILKRIFCKAEIESQFSSAAQSCPTLWDPMNRSTPGLVSNNSNNYNFSLTWMPDKTVTVVWDLRSFSLCDIGPHTSGYRIVLDSAYEKPVAPPIILKNQKCPHKISTILLWEWHQVGEFSVVFCMSELLMNRDVESFQGHWCSKQLWNIQIGSVSEQRLGTLIAYYKASGFLSLGLFSCHANHCVCADPSGPLHIALGNWDSGNRAGKGGYSVYC